MTLKDKLKHWQDVFYNKYYPLTVLNREKNRRLNTNKDFSLIVGNCIGGYIYHQLDVPFLSPTINLMMYESHFLKFVSNLDYYLSADFKPIIDPQFPSVPTASLGDILVHFSHYRNVEEGISCWNKRKKRINKNNLYIITSDKSLTPNDIKAFGNVPCKKIVIFTSKKYDYPYCLHVKRYDGLPHVGVYIGKTFSGKWVFEQFFDYVSWLNSDDPVAQHFSLEK